MEESGVKVETLSPNEVITCLCNKNSAEKCRIGISDILVYENGRPARWYVTGKTGEVTKKRGVDIEAISQRWIKVANQNKARFVAIIRQQGQLLKFLTEDAWQGLIEGGLGDPSIISLHCFIKGNNHTYFRNSFHLRDKFGRFTTTTKSYCLTNIESAEEVVMVNESDCKFVECRASSIRNIMDLATNTIIRYLEAMLDIKVISISVDYVVDSKSQLWLLWTSEAKFARGNNLMEMDIPGVFDPDKSGRMSWAGDKYAEIMNETLMDEREGKKQGDRTMSTINTNLSLSFSKSEKYSPEKASPIITTSQVNKAGEIIDEAAALPSEKRFVNREFQSSHTVVPTSNPAAGKGKFPDPFRCHGDYCRIRLQTVGPLYSDSSSSMHFAEKLFTKKEIDILKKDKRFGQMMEFGADGPGLAAISMKSIILARQDRRGMEKDAFQKEPWESYPLTPRQKGVTLRQKLAALDVNGGSDAHTAELERDLKLQEDRNNLLTKDKDHVESFSKQMASFYDQVRVCGVCFGVYSLLDWARNALGKSDAHTALLEPKGASLETSKELFPVKKRTVPPFISTGKTSKVNDIASSKPDSPTTTTTGQVEDEQKEENKSTWKKYTAKADSKSKVDSGNFNDLDGYLRGGAATVAARKAKEKEEYVKKRLTQLLPPMEDIETKPHGNELQGVYRGKIILGCRESDASIALKAILEEAFFDVIWVTDGRQVLNDFSEDMDCVIVERDLPLSNAFQVTQGVRDVEKNLRRNVSLAASIAGSGKPPSVKRHPILCLTSATSPEDIKAYMKADMDGCLSFPINAVSVLNTVRAAIPHHLAAIQTSSSPGNQDMSMGNERVSTAKRFRLGDLGELEGSTDSSTVAAKTLPISQANGEEIAIHGVIQIDADTRVSYTVLDASRNAKVILQKKKPFFNLVVCQDIFDTSERFKIFFRSLAQRYLGLQVLLWNYPGQAFTEWRPEQLLNNEYMASCLNEVMGQLSAGDQGVRDFDGTRPFYVLGYGFGASVASFYAAHYRLPYLRGVIAVNGWSYVDSYVAGVLHDCINIFQCSPESRPDLPVYFFSRFLFSKDYLSKVSVPLALNIYTAVHNPISIKGRLALCKGCLQNVDCRPTLKEIDTPLICIQSTQDSFCRPMHTEPFITYRSGEVRSVFRALQDPSKTCIVWMKSGHEVFQECRKQMQLLLEQLLTGYHESHDISYPAASIVDPTSAGQGLLVSKLPWEKSKPLQQTVEDKFIDGVLNKVDQLGTSSSLTSLPSPPKGSGIRKSMDFASGMTSSASAPSMKLDVSSSESFGPNSAFGPSTSLNNSGWEEYSKSITDNQIVGLMSKGQKKKKEAKYSVVIDPNSTSFERQDNSVYRKNATNDPNIHEYPEVKEYMNWRLKRNKKRLQRLQVAARTIQNAYRAHLARNLAKNIRRKRAAMIIQRSFRGWLGRCKFLSQARRIWATLVIQRTWRGYLGRRLYFMMRVRVAAAAHIQRVFRGHRSRLRVAKIRKIRHHAASVIQAMARRRKARKEAFRRRMERNASVVIQRMYRGHLGRRKAMAERDKYIFSKSQSQGIEFGRQMLLEHKLHATKLQSDVTLLSQEKVGAEEQVEALLEEISSFEEGVRTLEKEMHQLSKVEAEAANFMDEESRYELREQKIRLDKEFGEMLSKISNRKEMLIELEKKLSTIDKARQSKEEELRTLERKLVVLLEEQQNELNAIKRKQDVRGALLAASHEQLMKATASGPGSNSQALITNGGGGGQSVVSAASGATGGSGYNSGPSLQEKKQAAQLMQSTETLMKFGFMSMSMTYFSSLNMIKALRTVSAQDTVMAALADVHSQRAVAGITNGESSQAHPGFIPDLKPGQLGGQETLRVSGWSVQDVAKWLHTISLGQYAEAFIDAAIDGEFLYDLNDDDLKNTLGIEHRLHRKKILNCVHRLKVAEAQRDDKINSILLGTGAMEAPVMGPDENVAQTFPDNPFQNNGVLEDDRRFMDGPKVKLPELMSFVRHSKMSLLKEALDYLPNKKFDKTLVKVPFVKEHGTVYVEGYERLVFTVNKCDEHGNTMLGLACQNGNVKICKYLMAKGANPNHQNHNGQTAAHFAVAYKFYDLAHWLFENGASDTIENIYGLTPYDGLAPEGEGEGDGGDDPLAIENGSVDS